VSIHRFAFCLLAVAGVASLGAQNANTFMTITASVPEGRFKVDGQFYTGSAVFSWVVGSKHVLQALDDLPPAGFDPSTLATREYLKQFPTCYLTFAGWTDTSGQLSGNGSSPVVSVTADPSLSNLVVNFTERCLVFLNFYGDNPPDWPNTCDVDSPIGTHIPKGIVSAGGVLSHTCYWNNVAEYVQVPAIIQFTVYASPGYLFDHWAYPNDKTATGLINSFTIGDFYNLQAPYTLTPVFAPGVRVRFLTTPPGLQVVVDHETVPTIKEADATATSDCAASEKAPPPVAPYPAQMPRMCYGDFDFAVGSVHTVGAPSPQNDGPVRRWVFNSFSPSVNAAGQYTVPGLPDVVTANFLPAANISWITTPPGLKLVVDGQTTYSGGAFWGVNSTHSLSAPMQQRDANNKVWDFQSWSNLGAATQMYTVPAAAVSGGAQLIARYAYDADASSKNLLTVQSTPPGLTLLVDGQPCVTPCTASRPNDTTVRITAPASISTGAGTQNLFQSWSDMGAPDHQVKLGTDITVIANYTTRYQLSTAASPSSGGSFIAVPMSADGYYTAGSQVTLSARPATDYRFTMWGGSLSGSAATTSFTVQAPMQVTGYFQRQSDTPGVFVQNAAGQTPQPEVAAGSLVSIYGANLAPGVAVGGNNPVPQTLNGVVVVAAGHILPLMYVSPWQINALLPGDLAPGDYDLTVSSLGNPDVLTSFTVARNAPGLLTYPTDNRPYALALHQDGSLITPSAPAIPGETITVLGTGFGPLTLPYIDGFPAPPLPENALVDPVTVSLGGSVLTPSWSGAAVGFVGLDSLQIVIDDTVPTGATLEMVATVNGVTSNTVLLPIQ